VCDRRLAIDRPSQLPAHLLDLAAGRRVILHAMNSTSDSLSIAMWEAGRLRRALSVGPDSVVEDIGLRLGFEEPFWTAQHPTGAHVRPGRVGPVPFAPLEMGEAALLAWFGFRLEGSVRSNQVDPGTIALHGYRTADQSGAEQAARQAALEEFRRTHTLRRYKLGPGGRLVELNEP
jgi:hypothetical protein